MKKFITCLLIGILLISGLILLLYPYISFWLSERDQSYAIQNYDDSIAKLNEEQLQEEWERAVAYNEALDPGRLKDPFTFSGSNTDKHYMSLLDMDENGVMCHIELPKIGVNISVYHGTSPGILDKGAGHMEGSALPVGGEGTHCVLTGHTGLNTAKMFTDLTEVDMGDEFYLHTLDRILAYQVDQILVVDPSDDKALYPVPGKDYVTLLTCTPYGINSHRLLVRGTRVSYTPEEIARHIEETEQVLSRETLMLYAGLGGLAVFILLIMIFKLFKRKRYQRYS